MLSPRAPRVACMCARIYSIVSPSCPQSIGTEVGAAPSDTPGISGAHTLAYITLVVEIRSVSSATIAIGIRWRVCMVNEIYST